MADRVTRAGTRAGGALRRARWARRRLLSAAVSLALALFALTPAHGTTGPAERWTRYGLGIVSDLQIAELDGDGIPELIVGGRGVGLVDADAVATGQPRWVNKWLLPDGTSASGDGGTVTEIVPADLDGDGSADVLAGSDLGLFAIDGRTGRTRWMANDAAEGATNGGAWELAVGDFDRDGIADAVFSEMLDDRITAVDGTDGSVLWQTRRPLGYIFDLAAADVNGDGWTDAVVVGSTGVGLEILALSGAGAAATGVALPLWAQSFPAPAAEAKLPGGATAGTVAVTQAVPGGTPEVVVGGDGGVVVLDGLTGAPVARALTGASTHAGRVVVADVTGDATPELVTGVVDLSGTEPRGSVRAFAGDGAPLWNVAAPGPVAGLLATDLDGDGTAEAVASGGWQKHGGREDLDGFALAIDGQGGTRWEHRTPEAANALAAGSAAGVAGILLGHTGALGDGGGLTALDPTGRVAWAVRTGGRINQLGAADLDGDGAVEILEAALDSAVAVHEATGPRRWERRLPGKGGPDGLSVTAGDVTAHPGLEVVVGTGEIDPKGPPGRVHLHRADGTSVWSRDVGGLVQAVAVDDGDGDGADEILIAAAASSIGEDGGVVTRYSPAGDVLWSRSAPTGQRTTMALVDLDGDGDRDLLLTKNSVFHGGAVFALDGATGATLWRHDLPNSVTWASVDPALGVAAGDLSGRLHRLDAASGAVITTHEGGSPLWGGAWSIDADGDGVRDLLGASHDGRTRMFSGTDLSTLWTATTDDTPAHVVLTYTGQHGPSVAVGALGNGTYGPAELLLLDARTGARREHRTTASAVLDLRAADLDGDGDQEVLAAAGWQLVALDG